MSLAKNRKLDILDKKLKEETDKKLGRAKLKQEESAELWKIKKLLQKLEIYGETTYKKRRKQETRATLTPGSRRKTQGHACF